MRETPDFENMSEAERAAWHEARRDDAQMGRVVKRRTRDRVDVHLSVRLYPHQIERLRRLAELERRTVSALVRRFVEQKLDEFVEPMSLPSTEEAETTKGAGEEIVLEGVELPSNKTGAYAA